MSVNVSEREKIYQPGAPAGSQLVSQKRFNGFLSKVWVRLRIPTRDGATLWAWQRQEWFPPRLEGALGGDSVTV